LMAIADAVREVSQQKFEQTRVVPPEIGRRGHLRGLPSS